MDKPRERCTAMTSIKRLKEDYDGEWLAIAVTKKSIEGPSEGDLLFHSTDRSAVWKAIRGDPRNIYVTYAGPLIDEDMAIAL